MNAFFKTVCIFIFVPVRAHLTIHASQGAHYDEARDCLTAYGPVHAKEDAFTLTCATLKVYFNALKTVKRIEAIGSVHVNGPQGVLKGDHLTYDVEGEKGILLGAQVHFAHPRFNLWAKKGLHYCHKNETLFSLGPGFIKDQKGHFIEAQRLSVVFVNGKIEKAFAQDRAVFKSPSHCAQAQKIIYNEQMQKIFFEDKVRICSLNSKSKYFISGNKAFMDLSNNQFHLQKPGDKVGFSCAFQNKGFKQNSDFIFHHPQSQGA